MHVVNVRQLKGNPSTALREAREGLVVVMNRDKPDAVLIGFEQMAGLPGFAQARQAMAVNLFKSRLLSVGAAAKLANEPVAVMLTRLSKLGIPVVDYSEQELIDEVDTAAAWVTVAKTPAKTPPKSPGRVRR